MHGAVIVMLYKESVSCGLIIISISTKPYLVIMFLMRDDFSLATSNMFPHQKLLDDRNHLLHTLASPYSPNWLGCPKQATEMGWK